MAILYAKFDGSHLPDKQLGAVACALYLKGETAPLRLRRELITVNTSGEAEFVGFILTLETISEIIPDLLHGVGPINACRVYGDNQTIFKHIRGTATPKQEHTKKFLDIALHHIDQLSVWGIPLEMYWAPRRCNRLADILCKTAYALCSEPYLAKQSKKATATKETQ